jgi:hypothetical protein
MAPKTRTSNDRIRQATLGVARRAKQAAMAAAREADALIFIEPLAGGPPDVLFLSEAFTGPTVMYRLAKVGFSQSYTYFAWRNT